MNPLVKKEIRLLLPGFLIGVLLTVSNFFLPETGSGLQAATYVISFLFTPTIVIMLALGPFGAELNAGTFSMLLAQPIPRLHIWRIKTALLAAALIVIGLCWCVSFYIRVTVFQTHNPMPSSDIHDLFVGVGMFLLVVYSGALWTILLIRQAAAAFWFTFLVPGIIFAILGGSLADQSHAVLEGILVTMFAIYGAVGFLFARRLFLRAQDTAWTGGTIALPGICGMAGWESRSDNRRMWRPRAALLSKEFQVHQAQFIMAAALALFHLGVIATRKLVDLNHYPSLKFVTDIFWMLWLVMPVLIGCAAVAEERKMGTLEGQLCLPIKRSTPFHLKFFVVIVLSIVTGTLIPLLLEGSRILPKNMPYFGLYAPYGPLGVLAVNLPLLLFVFVSIGLGGIAYYVSSFSKSTLQTLAPAVFGIFLAWFLCFAGYMPEEFIGYPLWRGILIYLVGAPVLITVLFLLTYWNYKHIHAGWNIWRKNLFVIGLSLALVILATTAIYHRTWELLSTSRPPHGAVQFVSANPPRVETDWNCITVFLPDGHVWVNRYVRPDWIDEALEQDPSFGNGKFLDGTNWVSVVNCRREIVGIQRDGSLWVSAKPDDLDGMWRNKKATVSQCTTLERLGQENDWAALSGRNSELFLLKTNGTLWAFDTSHWSWKKPWPGIHTFKLEQLGTNSDWKKIYMADHRSYFRKNNGDAWVYRPYRPFADMDAKLTLTPQIILGKAASHCRSMLWCNSRTGMSFGAAIDDNGTFNKVADWQQISHSSKFKLVDRRIQIGTETNWLAAVSGGDYENGAVLLKRDGTLWQWKFESNPDTDFQAYSVHRFTGYSDWMAIENMGGLVALAADGSLWLHQFDPQRYFRSEGIPPLLAASRKPIFLGNIFNDGR